MKTSRINVTGRVQGVFFRANTKEIADNIGVRGQVKNESSGGVLIIAQGSDKQIREFISRLKESPGASKVEMVKTKETETTKEFNSFIIVRDKSFFIDKKKAIGNLSRKLLKS